MDLPCMKTIVEGIVEGIVSICKYCKSLLDAQVDPTTLTYAEYCLKNSKTQIEEKRKYLEQCIEQLIKEKENEQQNKAKCNASDISQEIERQRARQNTGTGVTIGGAVLAAIPIIGWIPGIIMLGVGTSEMVKASNAIRDAEHQRNKEIEELKQNLQFTAEIQKLVNSAMNLLNVLKAMERHTQSDILWEPVKEAMEDVMKAAENVAENRLVYSQNVSDHINTLMENVAEILALLRY